MNELEIKHVYKHYPIGNKEKFTALTDINVSFKKGELVSIVGESGSGKSTLMNLIGGLDSQFEGDIMVEDMNLRGQPDKVLDKYRKNKVGFVFQSFNLIPHLSILDNVTIALTLSGVSDKVKQEKATAILTRLGLGDQLKKKPDQLSGGQKQRVAIARALINDPDIILADEPTGALDSGTTLQILEIMKQISDEGKLVIMVTHSEKVASISSRVVEISDGKIVRDEVNPTYKKDKVKKEDKIVRAGEKQNFPLWSAIRLAFHNMWASKTKNFLMAFGVAISIVALIIMMSFGSGLDDYIAGVSNNFTSPNIVTITKKTSNPLLELLPITPFGAGEDEELLTDLNGALEEAGYEPFLTKDDLIPGYCGLSMEESNMHATFTILGYEEADPAELTCVYSTPPYYNEDNLIEGEMADNSNFENDGKVQVMLNPGVYSYFKTVTGEKDVIGKTINLKIEIIGLQPILVEGVISGVIDSSVIQKMTVAFIDYEILEFYAAEKGLSPFIVTTYYIDTEVEYADVLREHIMTSDKYSGSIESSLTGMFSEMSKTVSVALTIISCISLIVSAIMILVVLYISVSERTKEIGVLKSIGARRKDIRSIFTSESLLVGILSGIVGIILSMITYGIFLLVLNSLLGFAPLSLKWWYFFLAMGVSVVISMLSGLYPSAKAARLDPVESLRRE